MEGSMYDSLKERIKQVSRNEKERRAFHEIVTQYFEGKVSLLDLPEMLMLAVYEWEKENKGGER